MALFWAPLEFTWQSSLNSSSVNSLSDDESILSVFRCGELLLMALPLSCEEAGHTMLHSELKVDELVPSVGGDVPQAVASPKGEESCLRSLSELEVDELGPGDGVLQGVASLNGEESCLRFLSELNVDELGPGVGGGASEGVASSKGEGSCLRSFTVL